MMARRAVLFALMLMACVGAWGQTLTLTPTALPTTPFPVNQPIPTLQFQVDPAFQNDPIQWSESGSFPPGLNFDPVKGGITGTPTQAGLFIFTVSAVDASTDFTGSRQYSLYISLGPLTLSPLTYPAAAAGTFYVASPFRAGGGVPGYTWALQNGTSVNGLAINASSGQLSGTPLIGAIWIIAVVLTDASGAQTSANFNLNVLGINGRPMAGGTVGTAYSQTLTAAGSTGTLSWLVTGSNLPPPGLTLSSQGQITGTPTTLGTFPFVVQVTDAASRLSASAAVSITIASPATISPPTLPGGVVNVPYASTTLTVQGVTISNWVVTVGTLPAGLNLHAVTGVISGTPTAAGSSTFTISATPASLVAVLPPVVQVFTIVISAAPSVTITGLPQVGVAATQSSATVALSGGTYPLNITGTMTLAFTSVSGGSQNYDAKFGTGTGTTVNFTIPPGSATGLFGTASSVPVIIGTVAGTINITTVIQDSAGNTLPPPAPIVIAVNSTVPVIIGVTPGAATAGVFSISVTGRSTPRNMTSAVFHFTSPTGTTLASADITVPLTSAFTNWYGSTASIPFGSSFTMTVQFSYTGPPGQTVPYTTVTVTLTNSVGASTTSAPVSP